MPKTRKEIAREIDKILASPPRSSVRLVRSRQAAIRDYNLLVAARPPGPRGDASARWFVDGFEYVRHNVLQGYSPEEAYDLSTSVKGAPVAFHDGASCARSLYNSRRPELVEGIARSRELAVAERAQAEKLAKAYRVKLPNLESEHVSIL